jgi:hypothetical protein
VLAVVILAGTVLYSQQNGSLAALTVNLEDLVSVRWKNPLQAQSKPAPEPFKEKILAEERVEESRVIVPPLEERTLSATDINQDDGANSKVENSVKPPLTEAKSEKETTKTSSDQARTAKPRTQTENFFYYNNDAGIEAEKLEFEIHKAIHNRAIRGVEVSVRDGKVYLTGQVATEKQKLAAAQAARSVAGAKEVRDQITVHSGYDPGQSS